MSVPQEMTVVEIAAPGGPEQLKTARRPVPKAAAGEVLIRVAAAGVNRPDVMQRQGRYPPPPGASDIPALLLDLWRPAAFFGATGLELILSYRVGTTVVFGWLESCGDRRAVHWLRSET